MERILTQIVPGAPASPLSLSNGLAQPHLSPGFLQQDFCLQFWEPASLFHYATGEDFLKQLCPHFPLLTGPCRPPSTSWLHLLVSPTYPAPRFCHSGLVAIHPMYLTLPSSVFWRTGSKRQEEGGDAGERDDGRQKETQGVMRGEEVEDRAWY